MSANFDITHSHGRKSMGKWEIRPLPHPNPLTDHHQKLHMDYVIDIYPHAKFSDNTSRGFFSPYARNCTSKMFTPLLYFVRVLPMVHSPGPWTDFHA